jgi:hypothetical protein
VFGALWTTVGSSGALVVFGGGLTLAIGASFVLLRRAPAPEGLVAPTGRWLRHRGCTSCPLSELEHTCPGQRSATASTSASDD